MASRVRSRPFPVEVGLFGQPTLVNNVETLANVPSILLGGGAAFAAIGSGSSTGTKLFCVSGRVERPGLYELPFGVTLGQLLELAGGVAAGGSLQAILLGGAAGAFVGPDALAMPLTFEGTRAAGATLGSGVVMVFDQDSDLGAALLSIASFFRDESCGQCVPCRVGTVRQLEMLQRLRAGRPNGSLDAELATYRELAQAMRDASICGLGQTAVAAVESAFERLAPFGRRRDGVDGSLPSASRSRREEQNDQRPDLVPAAAAPEPGAGGAASSRPRDESRSRSMARASRSSGARRCSTPAERPGARSRPSATWRR